MHRITLDNEPRATVVTAKGELDAYVADELVDAFERAAGQPRVLVDFTAVSFLDSTALGTLVRAVRDVGERGGDIRVVLPEGTARRIFELTTLDRVLPVSASREQGFVELEAQS